MYIKWNGPVCIEYKMCVLNINCACVLNFATIRQPILKKYSIAFDQRYTAKKIISTTGSLHQRFHLEGHFLPKGNLGLRKEIWKEIAFGRKLGGNIVIRREMRRKFYFIS